MLGRVTFTITLFRFASDDWQVGGWDVANEETPFDDRETLLVRAALSTRCQDPEQALLGALPQIRDDELLVVRQFGEQLPLF